MNNEKNQERLLIALLFLTVVIIVLQALLGRWGCLLSPVVWFAGVVLAVGIHEMEE